MAVAPHGDLVSGHELARQVGRAEPTVRKWKSRADWPFGEGPFNVAEVRDWMRLHLGRDPAQRYHDAQQGIGPKPMSQIEKARAWNFVEAAQIRRIKREQLEGKLHDTEECRTRRLRQLHALRNGLTRSLPRALSAEIIGRSRGDVERLIRSRIVEVLDRLAGGGDAENA